MYKIPKEGRVLAAVSDLYKKEFLPIAEELHRLGFEIYATGGTGAFLKENGVPCTVVNKVGEGHPDVLELVRRGEIDMIIDTPTHGRRLDSYGIVLRRAAVENAVTCFTFIDTARAMVDIIKAGISPGDLKIFHLEELKG